MGAVDESAGSTVASSVPLLESSTLDPGLTGATITLNVFRAQLGGNPESLRLIPFVAPGLCAVHLHQS